ncbi:unnamed protein product [Callosobruchus maculatus]|uniref:RIIa domain-containing protein n=1 Tax=Callosobruchus maculatus TaxID=64391 RepID=A0A653C7K4_CALMS|nr:unnamed protein product [Callosobruchus maculatus]
MNVMLQRHSARYIYVVPEGLKELMSDISREVLRVQPENIYMFVADYLDALMITRENARVAARLVQSITEITTTTCEFLEEAGMERLEADRVVSVVRATFQKQLQPEALGAPPPEEIEEANMVLQILDEAQISAEKGEAAARIIQRAFRNFKQRRAMERELLSGMIDWRVAARSAIYLYRKTGVTNEEANRAATLIKAAYKGYYTRRFMRRLAEEVKMRHDKELEQEAMEMERSDSEELRQSGSARAVKINYDTVIPHVDFGGSEHIPGADAGGSTASVVGAHAYNAILHKTFEMLGLEEHEQPPQETQDDHPPPPPPTAEDGAGRTHDEEAPAEPEGVAEAEPPADSQPQEVHSEAPAE